MREGVHAKGVSSAGKLQVERRRRAKVPWIVIFFIIVGSGAKSERSGSVFVIVLRVWKIDIDDTHGR